MSADGKALSGESATRAFIALGSNLGDRRATLERAIETLAHGPGLELVAVSPWIETRPWGASAQQIAGQGPYLNGAAELKCRLTARGLLERLLALEAQLGRVRGGRPNAARTLDLDLLLFGTQRIDEPGLSVPHPALEQRVFVLEPLAAIAPELVLPSGLRVRTRLEELGSGAPRA